MTNHLETMQWLSVQFRDRANEDQSENTEKDAVEVEGAKDFLIHVVDALRNIVVSSQKGDYGSLMNAIEAAGEIVQGLDAGNSPTPIAQQSKPL